MGLSNKPRFTYDRFQRFVTWYVVILGGFAILFLAMLVLTAYVFDGRLTIYVNKLGEVGAELVLFAIIVGTVPFALYVVDEFLRSTQE